MQAARMGRLACGRANAFCRNYGSMRSVTQSRGVSRRSASVWLTALMKFGLTEEAPSEVWLAAALELTRSYEVSFYDAAYHALAITSRGYSSRPTFGMPTGWRGIGPWSR